MSRSEVEDLLDFVRKRVDHVEEVANLSSLTAAQAARDCEVLIFDVRTLWRIVAQSMSVEQRDLLCRELRSGVVGAVASEDVRDHLVADTRAKMSGLAESLADRDGADL